MIAGEGEGHLEADEDATVAGHDGLFRATHAEDGNFGIVYDGRGERSAVGPDVGDGKSSAGEFFAGDGAILALVGQFRDFSTQREDGDAIGLVDDGDHEAVIGVDGNTHVDDTLDEDFGVGIVDIGVELGEMLECAARGLDDEWEEGDLFARGGLLLTAEAVEPGDVGRVHDGKVHGGADGLVQRVGDLASDTAEWDALRDARGINLDGRKGLGWAGGSRRCGKVVEGTVGSSRGRRNGGRGGTCGAFNIGSGHTTAAARATDPADVDFQIPGEFADGWSCSDPAITAQGGDTFHGTDDRTGIGSGIRAGESGWRRGMCRGRCWGRGMDGGRRIGDRLAVLRGVFEGDNGVANVGDITNLPVELGDASGVGTREFCKGLVCLDLGEGLHFGDGVALLDLPGDDFDFVEAFTKIWEDVVNGLGHVQDVPSNRCSGRTATALGGSVGEGVQYCTRGVQVRDVIRSHGTHAKCAHRDWRRLARVVEEERRADASRRACRGPKHCRLQHRRRVLKYPGPVRATSESSQTGGSTTQGSGSKAAAKAASASAVIRTGARVRPSKMFDPDVRKYFVLDTSVLVHDPSSIFAFDDNEVIIPLTVLEELDKLKKSSDGVGRNAREAIRNLDDLRLKGRLIDGIPLNDRGGMLRVSLSDNRCPHLKDDSPDNRIISTAWSAAQEGHRVVFVSKDINARLRADSIGLIAEDFESQKVDAANLYTGFLSLNVDGALIDELYTERQVSLDKIEPYLRTVDEDGRELEREIRPNQFVQMRNGADESHAGLARRLSDTNHLIPITGPRRPVFGVMARNVQQTMALDLLLDDDVRLVTLIGTAGTGKTLLALAAGMTKIFVEERYDKLLVARPIMPLGRDIGYLPGDKDEKLTAWMQPIFDNLTYLLSTRASHGGGKGGSDGGPDSHSPEQRIQKLMGEGKLILEPLTYIRGRSIPNQFMIVDEAQNLTPHEVKTIASRVGDGTKLVLTGDIAQIDNPYLDAESNGLSYLIERMKDQGIVGHVTLEKSERSELASLVAELL